MLTPNRIVAFLTPIAFAPLAGAISAWVAENAPGLDLSEERLTSIFIAGALVALAPALQWLHGWQKYEQREAEAEQAVALANSEAAAAALGGPAVELEGDADLEEDAGEDQALDELEALEDDGGEFDEFEESEDPLVGDEEPARAGA